MPLLDHFHPPLAPIRHWEAFHSRWANAIADALNSALPVGYFAEAEVHVGMRLELDVAAWESRWAEINGNGANGNGSVAVATAPSRAYAPPAPELELPFAFPNFIEVLVYNPEGGARVVGAAELVSPANKDRDETRRAFAAKCASLLQSGAGLLIIDVVTSRNANMHNELADLLEWNDEFQLPLPPLYATAYRPIPQPEAERIQVWSAGLNIGQSMPVMPLALDRGLIVPIDLEATYTEACRRSRLSG